MFNLNFKIELSDILLVLGISAVSVGVFLIYRPAALVLIGAALIFMAFNLHGPEVKK